MKNGGDYNWLPRALCNNGYASLQRRALLFDNLDFVALQNRLCCFIEAIMFLCTNHLYL